VITYCLRGSVDDEVMNVDCVECEVCAGFVKAGACGHRRKGVSVVPLLQMVRKACLCQSQLATRSNN
jgi:hypothetical protein